MSRRTKLIAACGVAGTLAVPAVAGAHTTISALQPQGTLLTAKSGTYVVRSPNETPTQQTWKIVMYVPPEVQQSITIQHLPDWRIIAKRVDTGQKDSEGNAVMKTTQISWTAKTADDQIAPGEFGQWPVRFTNPAVAGSYCFGFSQFYTNLDGTRRKPDIVNWTEGPTGDHPKSCLTIADAAPAMS